MKQVMIYDIENDMKHGGILMDDGSVICGCCGGLISRDEIGTREECTHKILRVYNFWINLDEEICGDDYYEEEM